MKSLNWKCMGNGIVVCAISWIILNFAVTVFFASINYSAHGGIGLDTSEIKQRTDLALNVVALISAALGGYMTASEEPRFRNTFVAGAGTFGFVYLFLLAVAHKFFFPQWLWLFLFSFLACGFLRSRFGQNRVLDVSQTPVSLSEKL